MQCKDKDLDRILINILIGLIENKGQRDKNGIKEIYVIIFSSGINEGEQRPSKKSKCSK
jgi:hypothetical protein